jgi:thiol-disulfide isomerase/thioredoxin
MSIKKIVKEILIGATILLIATNAISYIRQPKLSTNTLPHLKLTTIDGKSINFEKYRGKPLLIHFWALWCPTCKMETSNIDIVSKEYQVVTVAVNSKDDSSIREFLQNKNVHFDVINDSDGSIASKFKVEVFPTTFIYNSDSKLLFSEVGYTSTAGLLARMSWATDR